MIVKRQIQVRPGRIAGTANVSHKLPLPDRRTRSYRQPGQVGINRLPAVRVIYHHAVAKRPHIAYAMRRRPPILDIADSARSTGIDWLAITVNKGNIYAVVSRVGIPGMAGERKSKPALSYGTGPTQGVSRQRIVTQDVVYIVNVTVPTPPMDSRLPDRKLPGIFLGVPAPGQRPGYVTVAEVVALQDKAYMGDIAGASCSRKLEVVGDNACPKIYGALRVNRRTNGQAHALGTLHDIAAYQLHIAA